VIYDEKQLLIDELELLREAYTTQINLNHELNRDPEDTYDGHGDYVTELQDKNDKLFCKWVEFQDLKSGKQDDLFCSEFEEVEENEQ